MPLQSATSKPWDAAAHRVARVSPRQASHRARLPTPHAVLCNSQEGHLWGSLQENRQGLYQLIHVTFPQSQKTGSVTGTTRDGLH